MSEPEGCGDEYTCDCCGQLMTEPDEYCYECERDIAQSQMVGPETDRHQGLFKAEFMV